MLLSAGPLSLVELRSRGGAGDWQGDCLGLYQMLPDKSQGVLSSLIPGGRQGPVYRQLHDGDNHQYYLYRWDINCTAHTVCCIHLTTKSCFQTSMLESHTSSKISCLCTEFYFPIRFGDFWHVNSEVGEKGRHLKAKVVTKEDQLVPPVIGWQYHAGGGKWQSDPAMECTSQLSPACSEVVVRFHHAAKDKLSDQWAGGYLPVEGKHNRGRPVGFRKSLLHL